MKLHMTCLTRTYRKTIQQKITFPNKLLSFPLLLRWIQSSLGCLLVIDTAKSDSLQGSTEGRRINKLKEERTVIRSAEPVTKCWRRNANTDMTTCFLHRWAALKHHSNMTPNIPNIFRENKNWNFLVYFYKMHTL